MSLLCVFLVPARWAEVARQTAREHGAQVESLRTGGVAVVCPDPDRLRWASRADRALAARGAASETAEDLTPEL